MRIIQIGNTDVVGTRFNGQDLHKEFCRRGMESVHCVWYKQADDPNTWHLAPSFGRRTIRSVVGGIESALSIQSLLYPFSWQLFFDKRFQSSDIAHYHLIHTGYFSLASLPFLTRSKPTVWTLHDPWAMTGHCVYPYDCQKWKNGCGGCPRLGTYIPMRNDRSSLMWKIKKMTYYYSKIDIILASKWMLHMAQQSPLLSNFRLHHIPFGIDLNVFAPTDTEKAKRQLGVCPGSFVITFRATLSEFKGLQFIKECLHRLHSDHPICLMTFNDRGLMDEFRGKYQLIDLGWVNDEELTRKAYNASDVFLMPSTAEAFGMMAMEAMACGKPVITFEDTSLPEVIDAPNGGLAVPQGDTEALRSTLEMLITSPEKRMRLGSNALEFARKNYDFKTHADRVLALYKDVIERRMAGKNGT